MYYSGNIYIFPNGKKLFMYANSDLLHFPTTKIPRRVIRCITKNLFHSQIYKSHHYPRNFGDWKMQKPQISILEKFFPLEKKKKLEEPLSTHKVRAKRLAYILQNFPI